MYLRTIWIRTGSVLDGNEWNDLNGNGQFDLADLADSDALAFDNATTLVSGAQRAFSGSGLTRDERVIKSIL